MNYFWMGVGTTFGTILGIVVSLVVYQVIQWRKKREKIVVLRRELALNLKKIEGLLQQLIRYRSKVASKDYFSEYLDLSRFLWRTAQNMLYSGLLFEYLKEDEDINNLQIMFFQLSVGMSEFVNTRVIQSSRDRDSIEAGRQLDFYEQQLNNWKTNLRKIIDKLPKKKQKK